MKTALATLLLLGLIALGIHYYSPHMLTQFLPSAHNATPAMQATPQLAAPYGWVAAAGRLEPQSEEIHLAFEISGLITHVHVKEGDTVTQGQEVATLKHDEQQANLQAAIAEARALQAVYDKAIAGARQEEKSETWAMVKRTQAVMKNAYKEMVRRQQLLEEQLIAPEESDRAIKDHQVAQQTHKEAMQRHMITMNLSRKEDLKKAQADLEAAQQRIALAKAQLRSTKLRSPLDGTVLRRFRHPGENVSIFFESPVLSVGNITAFNVRAEVDESDYNRVAVGQKAYFVCDAFGSKRFTGRVTRKTPSMGKKRMTTESPTEQLDAKVMEVLISVDSSDQLISGLIVDVFIETGSSITNSYKSGLH